MSELAKLRELVSGAPRFDPSLTTDLLRTLDRHVEADLIEALHDRVLELEHTCKLLLGTRKGRKTLFKKK